MSALVVAICIVAPAAAQAPVAPSQPRERRDLRHQIYVMEGALARAVKFGALQLNRDIRTISPETMMVAGEAQARGVYLEGYGVFFDVGVPILQQSMMWSLRTIFEQNDENIRRTIDFLRAQLKAERDPMKQRSIEGSIETLELQLSPGSMARRDPSSQRGVSGVGASMLSETVFTDKPAPAAPPPSAAPPLSAADKAFLQDPNRAYTEAVQRALVDAMIDYAAPMLLRDNEFLTVAARDNEPRDSLAPQDPFVDVVTVLLSIKGADLAAYRTGAIDREEAKKRVQIREF